jgi:arylsulfatase A-like enzyme
MRYATDISAIRRLLLPVLGLLAVVSMVALAGGRDAGAAETFSAVAKAKPGKGDGKKGGKGDGKKGDGKKGGKKKPQRMEQPNIVMVQTDDQSPRTILPESMPNLFNRLRARGTTFTDYIVTTPLCCPSRASILTGQYGHNNGVLRNFYPDLKQEANVLPSWLQRAGYNTAHVGKFLNSYEANSGGPAAVAPGWDLWFTTLEKRRYYNWKASKNGRVRHYGNGDKDHVTSVTTGFATRWAKRLARKKDPFYMQVDYYAPHTSTGRDTRCSTAAVPEPEDEGRFATYPTPRPPSYNEEDVSDKPAPTKDRTVITPEEELNIERRFRCTLEAVYGVDRGLGEIMDVLKQKKELDDTVIVFASDNGFFYGEHRIAKGKPSPYEENLRMPMTMYVPPKFRDRAELVPATNAPTANIDIAPTFLDLADADPCRTKRICRTMDGRSLMPLLDGTGGWPNPRAIGIELGACDYRGVRYERDVFFQYATEQADGTCSATTGLEMYDLDADPDQLLNLAPDGDYDEMQSRLSGLAERIATCSGIQGRDPEPITGSYCE